MRRKKPTPQGSKYRCKWCKKVVLRDSTKAWIRSWCDETGQWTRLMRVKED